MSLHQIDEYLCEFNELPYRLSENVVIGGGEGLSPYLFGNFDYIPDVLSMINSQNGVTTIKTNGVWAADKSRARTILKSLATTAHKMGKLVDLDISIDEFHNNIPAVANLFSEILSDEYITVAVRPIFAGFKTLGSAVALVKLKKELNARKILVEQKSNGDWCVYNEFGTGIHVPTDYDNEIFDIGRAKNTNVFTYRYQEPGLISVNSLQIDGNDNAILNNFYKTKINGRPLENVVKSLIQRAK